MIDKIEFDKILEITEEFYIYHKYIYDRYKVPVHFIYIDENITECILKDTLRITDIVLKINNISVIIVPFVENTEDAYSIIKKVESQCKTHLNFSIIRLTKNLSHRQLLNNLLINIKENID